MTTTDMSLDWLLGPQLRAFATAGYEVVGVSSPGPHVDAIEQAGVRHVAVPALTRSTDPRRDARAFRALVEVFRALRPDIVHTHNPKPGVLGRIAARVTRVPLVVNTQHGLYAQPSDRRRRRVPVYALERLAASFGDVELVQNEEDVAVLVSTLRVPARKVRLLGNGIDLHRFDPDRVAGTARQEVRGQWGIEPDDVVCGLVGRLVREKGFAEVVAGIEHLRRSVDRPPGPGRLRFVWIGPVDAGKSDATSDEELDRARRLGLVLAGTRTDMPECYAAFDLFLTASHREGFPRAVMEASAMGLPVVATDIRGNRQAVRDGTSGRLVPLDDPATLAEAVVALAADRDERARLGAGARALAREEFDQQRVIDRTLAAYAELDGST